LGDLAARRPGWDRIPEAVVARALTKRQEEVLRLLKTGLSNKAIAKRLKITPGTVKLHVAVVLRALGVHSRRQLA
jgi:DNA-binding NarL/FixJ family response regulator